MKLRIRCLVVLVFSFFTLPSFAIIIKNNPVLNQFLKDCEVGSEMKPQKGLPYYMQVAKKGFCGQDKACMIIKVGNFDENRGESFLIYALAHKDKDHGYSLDTGSYFPEVLPVVENDREGLEPI